MPCAASPRAWLFLKQSMLQGEVLGLGPPTRGSLQQYWIAWTIGFPGFLSKCVDVWVDVTRSSDNGPKGFIPSHACLLHAGQLHLVLVCCLDSVAD